LPGQRPVRPTGPELLERLELPEPWRSGVLAAVAMIDDLDAQIAAIDSELRRLSADHRYVPLLMTVPGIAWVLGYTIAAEIGDIDRFGSPTKLCGYTGLCPRVYQSGAKEPSSLAFRSSGALTVIHSSTLHLPFTPALPRGSSVPRAPGQAASLADEIMALRP
jgi:transposase